MAIPCIIILVPELLQIFDAHELHINIFNGHLNRKYEIQKFSIPFIYMNNLMSIIFAMTIKKYKLTDIKTSQNEK